MSVYDFLILSDGGTRSQKFSPEAALLFFEPNWEKKKDYICHI